MCSIDDLVQWVIASNPSEKEFHQAVREVVEPRTVKALVGSLAEDPDLAYASEATASATTAPSRPPIAD